jgi:hypothetical protein
MDPLNLNAIQIRYNSSEYQSTFQLEKDLGKMWTFYKNLHQGDNEKIEKITEIQQYADKIFQQYDIVNK